MTFEIKDTENFNFSNSFMESQMIFKCQHEIAFGVKENEIYYLIKS